MRVNKKRWETVANVFISDKRFPTKIAVGYWVFPGVGAEETVRHLLNTLLPKEVKKTIADALCSANWDDQECTMELSIVLRAMKGEDNGQEQK